jgi:hypothetical protein
MDPNIYSLFMAEDEPTAQEEAAALAQALRGQRNVGTMWQLSGDSVLGRVGGQLFGAADQAEDRLAKAGESRLARAVEAQKLKATAAKGRGDRQQELRKEFLGQQVVKNMAGLGEAIEKIRTADINQGSGQMGLLYGYLRALDPGSTVRESEFESAGRTGGLPSMVQGYFNQLLGKGFLDPVVAQRIKADAEKLVEAQHRRYLPYEEEYGRYARDEGLLESDVVPDLGYRTLLRSRPAPAPPVEASGGQGPSKLPDPAQAQKAAEGARARAAAARQKAAELRQRALDAKKRAGQR